MRDFNYWIETKMTTRRPLVVANWKMNGLRASVAQLGTIIAGAGRLGSVELIVCPPATLIADFAVAARGSPLLIGEIGRAHV